MRSTKPAFARHWNQTGILPTPSAWPPHDNGTYKNEPPSNPAAVLFALDPQMWIPEEQLYIRVEDTVAITETGVENLTSAAPLELDDVEKWMREPGMIQAFGPVSSE